LYFIDSVFQKQNYHVTWRKIPAWKAAISKALKKIKIKKKNNSFFKIHPRSAFPIFSDKSKILSLKYAVKL